jgi:hypothetical protein
MAPVLSTVTKRLILFLALMSGHNCRHRWRLHRDTANCSVVVAHGTQEVLPITKMAFLYLQLTRCLSVSSE